MSKRTETSESKLRGSLVKHAAGSAGPLAVSKLKGTLIDYHRAGEEASESRLAPEDYDLPDTAAEAIARKAAAEDLTPFDDPNGIIVPGQVFTSTKNPSRRRLVTNVYTAPRGNIIAAVHIEGSPDLTNLGFADVQKRIDEGMLVLPEAAK